VQVAAAVKELQKHVYIFQSHCKKIKVAAFEKYQTQCTYAATM